MYDKGLQNGKILLCNERNGHYSTRKETFTQLKLNTMLMLNMKVH